MKRLILAAICFCTISEPGRTEDFSAARQQNWHQWRGPLASGVAPHGDPPVRWDEENNIRWKVRVPGEGNSSPIVWGERVFVTTAVETDRTVDSLSPPKLEPPGGYKTPRPMNFYRFIVMCLERRTGRVLWERTANEEVPHEGHHPDHGYASASPITDGRCVYASFGSRGVYCYDLQGDLQWKRDLGDMVTRFGWGEGASPALHGDSLVVNWDHEGDSRLFVLDARTGQTRWQADRDEISSWSTPLVVEYQGTTQVIVSATRRVTSYDLAGGEILWECGGQTVNVIPSPVHADGIVYCVSGFRDSAAYAIPLEVRGDVTGTGKIAWFHQGGTPYVPSPLLYGGLLYVTRSNAAVLTCLDAATGTPLGGPVRLPELTSLYASPVGAAGRVYFVGRDGTTLVVRHQPDVEVLAVNRLDDPIDGSPAIVGREMFLRAKRCLYCIAEE